MVACISPADLHLSETISTLRYAARARTITNTPMVNSARRRAEVAALRLENEALRDQIRMMQDQVGVVDYVFTLQYSSSLRCSWCLLA
jgi:hypothetical protein